MEAAFDKLGIDNKLIDALKKENIFEPTDIQAKTIPLALENRDVVGESQTGSGKTLAFLLPIFQKIDSSKREMQSVILAPTHELVMQIDKQIKLLSENSNIGITSTPIMGEVNIKRQIEKLKEKPHIIIGSPGRILELIKMRKITAHTVKTIVIDEGDRLLDQNNIKIVKDIVKSTMKDRQLMIFSASINGKTLDIAKDIMKDMQVVRIEEKELINPKISHMFFKAEQRDKLEVLRKLIASIKPERAMIFLNKTEDVEIATMKLQYHHINACGIYGGVSKEDRKKALNDFRNGKIQLLISSDISARGLDIKDISHVINLDLPEDSKQYLHRVGRTGRAGKEGVAISIVSPKELSLIKKYENDFNIKINEKLIYKGGIIDNTQKSQTPEKTTAETFRIKKKINKYPPNGKSKHI